MERTYTVELTAAEMLLLRIACGVAEDDYAEMGDLERVAQFEAMHRKLFLIQKQQAEEVKA